MVQKLYMNLFKLPLWKWQLFTINSALVIYVAFIWQYRCHRCYNYTKPPNNQITKRPLLYTTQCFFVSIFICKRCHVVLYTKHGIFEIPCPSNKSNKLSPFIFGMVISSIHRAQRDALFVDPRMVNYSTKPRLSVSISPNVLMERTN